MDDLDRAPERTELDEAAVAITKSVMGMAVAGRDTPDEPRYVVLGVAVAVADEATGEVRCVSGVTSPDPAIPSMLAHAADRMSYSVPDEMGYGGPR